MEFIGQAKIPRVGPNEFGAWSVRAGKSQHRFGTVNAGDPVAPLSQAIRNLPGAAAQVEDAAAVRQMRKENNVVDGQRRAAVFPASVFVIEPREAVVFGVDFFRRHRREFTGESGQNKITLQRAVFAIPHDSRSRLFADLRFKRGDVSGVKLFADFQIAAGRPST